MTLDEECKDCLYKSQLKKVERERANDEKLKIFKAELRSLCDNPPKNYCAPLLMRDIDGLHAKIFGCGIDYSREKAVFNAALLKLEEQIFANVCAADDPVKQALKYSMAANYIDFARLADLDEGAVDLVMQAALRAEPSADVLELLKNKLKCAKTLCFLHDNCGEIVLDKILIRAIKLQYTQVEVTCVVRGGEIINDVTEIDAKECGLYSIAKVISNGVGVAGTPLLEVNEKTLKALESDVVISKGLGNLETVFGERAGFFIFCCKCNHIAERFEKQLFQSVMVYGGA